MSNKLKILLLDLELSYALAYFFPSKKPQYISAKQIKQHQFCVCAAWKWHDETSIYSINITSASRRRHIRDDKAIAVKLHALMESADIICAHNADNFDIKHCNTLFINHGLGPISEKKSIDTLKVARKYFAFAGNDLDSLSKRFGGKGKKNKPDWIDLTELDKKSIDKAEKYCKHDVRELERVFVKLRPYIKNIPHVKIKGPIKECHACGSKRIHHKGDGFDGFKPYKRVKCVECGYEMKGEIKCKN